MKFKFSIILSSLALAMSVGAGLSISNRNKSAEPVEAIGNYSTDADTYYNSITASSGKELAAQLHDLITSTHRYYTSYADNGGNGYQKYTDQYYENGTAQSGYIYEFYSGVKWPNGWYPSSGNTQGGYNREHCWCQSLSVPANLSNTKDNRLWGEDGGGADMHHLRPVEVDLNSTRGNNLYGLVSNRDSYKKYAQLGSNETYAHGGYLNGGVFEPLDSKKGDVARIILYTYIHYNSFEISDLFGSYGTTNGTTKSYFATSSTGKLALTRVIKTSAGTEAAAVALLLQWNTSDPVDDIERRRNEQVAVYQGNRNPFIDNSSYADAIWGTSTPGITSISKTSATLTTGNTTTISAVSSNSGTITWSTSNSNICSISSNSASSGSSITLTAGNTTGTATITASITISGTTYSKTCAVTVNAPKTLESIAISGQQTSFTVGDEFSFGGTVTATYTDSSTANVTGSASFSGYNMSTTGTQTVTVSYTENGTKTATYQITVSQASSSQSFSETYNYAGFGSTWYGSNFEDAGSFQKSSDSNNSVAYVSGIFTDKTITSDVVITLDIACFGQGTNPSSTKFKIYTSSQCTSQVTATQTGSLPTSSTYTSATYTISNSNAVANFTDDLAIQIASGTKLIRFRSFSVSFTYTTGSGSSEPTLESISLNTTNVLTTFTVGDTFNYDGLIVTAHYSDSSTEDLDSYDISEPDMSTSGSKTITVSYGGESTTYSITVNAAAVTLSSITVSNQKTAYYVGDSFVKPTVTAHYSDSSTADVTNNASFTGYNLSAAGNYTVTVSYTNGTTKTTTYSITVSAVELSSISVSTVPTKTTYTEGEYFDPTGLVITRTYNNSSSDTYAYANHTSEFTFTPTTSTALSTSNISVTISYGGKSTSQAITVNSSSGQSDEVTISSTMSQIVNANNYTISSGSSATCYTSFSLDEVITISTTGAANCGSFWGTSPNIDWRLYRNKNGNIIVTASSGYELDSVTFTYSTSNSGQLTDPSGDEITSGVSNSISGSSSTFTVVNTNDATNGQVRLTAISVTYHSTSSGGTDPIITSISATVSKTYYVGQTISSSDITVKDNLNNEISGFTFAEDGYQFIYSDASSGGAPTNKIFVNAITYSTFECSLTVQVQRKARVTPTTEDLSVTYTDLPTSYSTTGEERTAASGVKFIAYNLGNYSSKMQFRGSNGYFQTTQSMSLKTLTINNRESNTLIVYGSNSPNSFTQTITGTNDVYNLTGYTYCKVARTLSGAAYCSSITLTVDASDTAVNLANYIMYEDTANQCTTKFSTAEGYFEGLTSAERAIFMTSEDYVISTAKERLQAWANYLGKTITFSNNDYVISNNNNFIFPLVQGKNSNVVMIVVVVSIIGIGTIAGYFFIKRRKPE